MKVILREHVEGVGHLGDVLDVSDGFARNFLLPRKKALEATSRNAKEFEHHKRVIADKARTEKLELQTHAKNLSGAALVLGLCFRSGRPQHAKEAPQGAFPYLFPRPLSRYSWLTHGRGRVSGGFWDERRREGEDLATIDVGN